MSSFTACHNSRAVQALNISNKSDIHYLLKMQVLELTTVTDLSVDDLLVDMQWWWLSPLLRGFWEKVGPFTPCLHFFPLFF